MGRAVGWWTLLYLAFWLVVFVIAGVETLAPLPTFLPSPAGVIAAAGALVLLDPTMLPPDMLRLTFGLFLLASGAQLMLRRNSRSGVEGGQQERRGTTPRLRPAWRRPQPSPCYRPRPASKPH